MKSKPVPNAEILRLRLGMTERVARRFFAPLRMTTLALYLVAGLAGTLQAASGTMRTERFTSIREHDKLILALEDSALCDTCITEDSRGVKHQVYVDSGQVFYRHNEAWAVRAGREWSPLSRLSRSRSASSPVIFELAEPGKEPLLVVMWRQTDEGQVRVWRCLHFPGTLPMQWSLPLDVTLHRD
jgi:hypothetical protein